ncbi:MAG: Aspartate aminotransferase [Gemmatimonadaceae bacterium]|nr:Aspartate aminotransferase [Gemmatimonadaceae bacterium]
MAIRIGRERAETYAIESPRSIQSTQPNREMSTQFLPSGNVSRIKESATIAVSQRARALKAKGRTVIDLGAGEPDFATPEFIRDAAKRALDEGATKYTAVEGIPRLREAIAQYVNSQTPGRTPVEPSEVMVTTGSKQALFNACFSLFGQGDEVLVPTPAWTSYYEMVELARATCVPVLGDPAAGFKVTVDSLRAASTARTRGVMLNSPSNPTGAVYSAEELGAILALAEDRGWWVISDEIYRRIAYDGPATGSLQVARTRERLVLVDGVAKAFAMTGWRVGWSVAPLAVTKAMSALQSHTTSNATTMAQHATVAALVDTVQSDAAVTRMVAEYHARRDAALQLLHSEPGLRIVRPDGAFYLYLDVTATNPEAGDAGTDFATRLLDEAGVAIVPGAAFGTPGWVRISYAARVDDVVEGVRRAIDLWRSSRRA